MTENSKIEIQTAGIPCPSRSAVGRRQACVASVLFLIFAFCGYLYAQDWKEFKSEHFFVYFVGDEKFAKDVLDKAEIYYARVASDLGYPRYSEFWLWDKRAKIFIYPDHQSYLKATDQPQWSQGMADYKNKRIVSYAWSHDFLESLLPHEITHLIFRDFVGFEGEIPLWLDEGVAQWEEEFKRQEMKQKIKQLYDQDGLLTLHDMMTLDIRRMKQSDKVYFRSTITKEKKESVIILSMENLVNTYYLEAVSLVGFLLERYGSDRFAFFCRELRDAKTIEEALRSAYPDDIHSLEELESRWRESISKEKGQ